MRKISTTIIMTMISALLICACGSSSQTGSSSQADESMQADVTTAVSETVEVSTADTGTTDSDTDTTAASGGETGDQTESAGQIVVEEEDVIIIDETIIDDSCDHSWAEWVTKDKATCTENGYRERKCRRCGSTQRCLDEATGHTPETVPGYAATCSKTGITDSVVCSTCHSILSMSEIIPTTAHCYVWVTDDEPTETTVGHRHEECRDCHLCRSLGTVIAAKGHTHIMTKTDAVAATCHSTGNIQYWTCRECGCIYADEEGTKQISLADTVTARLEHVAELIPAEKATTEHSGLTEGYRCSLCGDILTAQEVIEKYKYNNPDLYASDYGYSTLADLDNGSAMQQFYQDLDELCRNFHIDITLDLTDWYFGSVNYTGLGITKQQALATFSVYIADHPLYYWLGNTVKVTSGLVVPTVSEAYYEGAVRAAYNIEIYAAAEQYYEDYTLNSKSDYETAQIVHDIIIDNMDYAYDDTGSAEVSVWAHNIIGFFDGGRGVCECYAKCFNLFLNCYDVESTFVIGYAGGQNHAWNMVRVDSGDWYYCDLTWDDTLRDEYNTDYMYFVVTGSETIPYMKEGQKRYYPSFTSTHTARESDISDKTNYQYPLPDCAAESYSN